MQNDTPQASPLQAGVQILTFEPGVYSVAFVTEKVMESDLGFGFPRARLDAPIRGDGLVVVAVQGENGWLARPGDVAMVQVTGARMSLLLSTYQIESANNPAMLRVTRITSYETPQPSMPAAVTPTAPPDAAKVVTGAPSVFGSVHVGAQGDVPLWPNGWGGAARGSGGTVEGFVLHAPPGIDPTELEYQGILGVDWTTPWTAAGEFCGSRGLALPLLGLIVRLRGAAASAFECRYMARFTDGTEAVAADGAPCTSASTAPVEAIQIALTHRAAAASKPGGKLPVAKTKPSPSPQGKIASAAAKVPPATPKKATAGKPAVKLPAAKAKPSASPKGKIASAAANARPATPKKATAGKPAGKLPAAKTKPSASPQGRGGKAAAKAPSKARQRR